MIYEYILTNWRLGQTSAERLACRYLVRTDTIKCIAPQCPRGGPDGGKDATFYPGPDEDALFQSAKAMGIVACYFPASPMSFREIEQKFQDDLAKAIRNGAPCFVFITGQKLTPGQREYLETGPLAQVQVFDLEHLLPHFPDLLSDIGIGVMGNGDIIDYNHLADLEVVRLMLACCDFWNLPLHCDMAPRYHGPAVHSHYALEEAIARGQICFRNADLLAVVSAWLQSWRALRSKILEKCDPCADGGTALQPHTLSMSAFMIAQYQSELQMATNVFLYQHTVLRDYLQANYAQALYPLPPSPPSAPSAGYDCYL